MKPFLNSMRRAFAGISLCLLPIVFCSPYTAGAPRVGDANTQGRNAETVRVGVLGLFHPMEFVVKAPVGHALVLKAGQQSIVIEDSGVQAARVRMTGSEVEVTSGSRAFRAAEIEVADRTSEPEDFILEIPGKITRRYHGMLNIKPSSGSLLAIVTLDLETAVASVVAAESASDTRPEGLKALAIASRSYFVSGRGRHVGFDFCDTTHCQFLRGAPDRFGAVNQAVEATQGLVLAYRSQPFAAMYTRSCSGRTRTPAELGITAGGYPYYAVECRHCRMHPARWTSRLSFEDARALRARTESARLAVAHRRGWSAVPGNDFSMQNDGDHVLLKGVGNGHGMGLCQAGARAMAASGSNFREILEHYYPNTTIISLLN